MITEEATNARLDQLRQYALARIRFLDQMERAASCRDPLAEFSEVLVADLLGAVPAASRVQRGYDLTRPNGRRVQVRYLANPGPQWINEHRVCFEPGLDDYALVIIVAFCLEAVLVFPREVMSQVCAGLGKRHPNQDTTLQLTRRNFHSLLSDPASFQAFGVEVFTFSEPGPQA